MEHYQHTKPPPYDLTLIQEEVHMWVGTADNLATPIEAMLISQALVNAKVQRKILQDWGHSTFHFAKNSAAVYQQMVNEIKELNAQIF